MNTKKRFYFQTFELQAEGIFVLGKCYRYHKYLFNVVYCCTLFGRGTIYAFNQMVVLSIKWLSLSQGHFIQLTIEGSRKCLCDCLNKVENGSSDSNIVPISVVYEHFKCFLSFFGLQRAIAVL